MTDEIPNRRVLDDVERMLKPFASMSVQVGVIANALETLTDSVNRRLDRMDGKTDTISNRLTEIERQRAFEEGSKAATQQVIDSQSQRAGWFVPLVTGVSMTTILEAVHYLSTGTL